MIGKTEEIKKFLKSLGSKPEFVKGDIFKAKDRKNIREVDKPTPKMKEALKKNIKKALAAKWR